MLSVHRRLTAGALGAVLVIAAAACSSAPAASSASTARAATAAPAASAAAPAASAAAPAASAAAAAPGQKRKIEIVGSSEFVPKSISVAQGETVTIVFSNKGEEKHNMVFLGEANFVSPDVNVTKTIEFDWTAPKKAGTIQVLCAYHAEMKMTVEVK